ncbi:hypothetical protein OI25_8118 (plasmid) [Paraburkholderia fungorum]|jgi:hypothetical protein|uniref:Uncharacterized protein n=2 Tax=Paraburkholderia fungorum TaxID=134537 RepID=A0AAU8T856_9BURK|nr:hypothetical protein OI25_8118 [Paraburkholderia fungorum]
MYQGETVMRETLLPVDLSGKHADDSIVDPTSVAQPELDCWMARRVGLRHLNGFGDQW